MKYLWVTLVLSSSLLFGISYSAANTTNITSAPNKGIIPAIYPHYKIKPAFYDFERMPMQYIAGVGRRFIMGTKTTLIEWTVKSGTVLPLHYHSHEQISWVTKGAFLVYSQGQKYILKAGQMMVFPPYVPHEFKALKDSVLVGIQSPVREDFLTVTKLAGIPTASSMNKLFQAEQGTVRTQGADVMNHPTH